MKDHFCPIEQQWIGYEGQCNWCGQKELLPKRTWVGLTDEEIMDMYNEPRSDAEMIAFGREIEAKLKEKNNA